MQVDAQIDVAIVGGGILGLLTAYEVQAKHPQLEIAIFEQESFIGDHTSARNSGVMHAGIYYPTGSAKHLYCMQGLSLWPELAQKLSIPFSNCGKYLVARDSSELPGLEKLKNQIYENGVEEVREVTGEELEQLNQICFAKSALFSRRTGIIDASNALVRIKDDLIKKDVHLLLEHKVENLEQTNEGFIFQAGQDLIGSKVFFNMAGLGAVKVRKMLGLLDFENYFVKGHYLKYTGMLNCSSLIYPIPLPELKGLGVHLTLNMAGEKTFGPNTSDCESVDYKFATNTLESMYENIRVLFRTVDPNKLSEDYCGIRPKLKRAEKLYPDFWLGNQSDHGIENYVELCGIESPGFTAAPALAKWAADQIKL